MSRFIEILKQASQIESQPIGFKRDKVFSKPKLTLIARLNMADIDSFVEHLPWVDAGLLTIKQNSDFNIVKKMAKSIKNIPWGVWLESTSRGGIKKAVETGCDFAIFSPEIPFETINDRDIDKVLFIKGLLESGLLETLDDLPVDAVIMSDERIKGVALTWRQLMLYRYFAGILRKPLLVFVSPDIKSGELQSIWETGVSGVIVEDVPEKSADVYKRLRKVIDGLTPPSKSMRTRSRAIVPKLGEELAPITDEDEYNL